MMTLDTYRALRTKQILKNKEYQLQLALEYAMQFNRHDIGDTVVGPKGPFVIEKISFSSVDLEPEPLYIGEGQSVPLCSLKVDNK